MSEKGQLIIMSGPSGVGKSTLVQRVMEMYPNLKFSVSATTREMRPGEVDGVNYYFIDKPTFLKMIEKDELLEYAEYAGNYYGTPAAPVREALEQGYDILLDVEVQGADQLIRKIPEAITVFIMAPSFEELERRLRGRGDTAEDKIIRRLLTARSEVKQLHQYQYLIISENGKAEEAADRLLWIIRAARCRTCQQDIVFN